MWSVFEHETVIAVIYQLTEPYCIV